MVCLTLLLASTARGSELSALASSAQEPPASGPVWLRLRGGYARSGEPRERYFGVLELGLALDVLVAGRSRAHAAASGAALAALTSDTAPGESP